MQATPAPVTTTAVFSNESLLIGNDTTEHLAEELICPEIPEVQQIFLKDFAYWIEGVILLSIGCPGILGRWPIMYQ